MADPFKVRRYPVDRLSDAELRDVLLVLLSDPRYGRLARKVSAPAVGFRGSGTSWADVGGMLSKALPGLQGPMDIGLADTVLKGKSRQELEDLAEVGFFEEAGRIPPGMRNPLPDILNAAKIAEDTATKFQTGAARIAQAMDVGQTAGTLRARSGQLISPTMTPRGSLPPAPVSPEGNVGGAAIDESMLSGADTGGRPVTPSLPAFKRGVSDATEAFWDINDRIASIRDQMAILRDDESPASKKKLRDLYEEWQILEQNSQKLMPYVFQKGEGADRLQLSKDELEFRREQERNVGTRHAASLGESAAGRQQAAAQFAERQAFEREKERTDLVKFQEGLEQQLRELTMRAASLNVPLGFQFQGPRGPVTPPTTQISLPAQAPNLQAALAAAGA